jgi:guanylate kinase
MGCQYGTSKMAIADIAGKEMIAVLDIEIDGVQQIQERSSIDARYVFIKPPSLEALGARLRSRGTEAEDDVLSRLARASDEIEFARRGVFMVRLLLMMIWRVRMGSWRISCFSRLHKRLEEYRSVGSV